MPLDLTAIPWRITNDGVMGGLSRSAVHTADGTLVFEGELSRENNGGFASVLGELDAPLHPFRGVRLTVAGDGRRYQVRLRSDDDARGIAWRAEFEAGPEPRRITLTPRDFEPVFRGRPVADAPALSEVTIRQFGFMLAGGEAGRFRLAVENVEFGAATDGDSNGRRLVIGASRGIGLAVTAAQLADAGGRSVIATHRAGSDMRGLDDLRERHGERLVLRTLDVTCEDDLEGFANWLNDQGGGIDLAIHAAGLLHDGDLQPEKTVNQCDAESLQRLFAVNAID